MAKLKVGILISGRGSNMRALLDARSEAQAVHGLEMRTELRFGDVANELVRQLTAAPDQLLILGVSDAKGLEARFKPLFDIEPRWPMLVVYRAPETDA